MTKITDKMAEEVGKRYGGHADPWDGRREPWQPETPLEQQESFNEMQGAWRVEGLISLRTIKKGLAWLNTKRKEFLR